MRSWWVRYCVVVVGVALAACGGGVEATPEAGSAVAVPGGDAVVKKVAEPPPVPKGLKAISKILAAGRVHRGVTYPMFEDGLLKTVLTAEEMIRVNNEELELVDMVIETYGKDRNPEYRIDLKSAKYYLGSEELTSEEESIVTGRTFWIRGDRMSYRSAGGLARMEGNIRMVISNAKSLTENVGGNAGKEPGN
ncbi:MAG: hypothetical protein P8J87_01395 [Verrucomicrobiales bacterium]|nr:hypothetical protein [Verrucomicrobiales bacterium]